MNVTCPNCATVYRVDPAKVPEAGVRARCAVCNAVFAVHREGVPARPSAPSPVASGVPAPPPPAPHSAPTPAPLPPRETAAPASHQHVPEPPRRIEPVREPGRTQTPKVEPLRAEPPRPAAPIAPKAAPLPPPAVPGGGPPRPAAPLPPPPRPTAPVASSASIAPPSAAPRATAPAAPARPVNPFLSQDPALKARRLARALISDMVVYHPAKRQEGLRDGNLKELFEEEIKKSWEEYADQVGRDVADTTNYFREALNEILAGGRQIF
jgi:predicted Zn finger-like uncharacterized protein